MRCERRVNACVSFLKAHQKHAQPLQQTLRVLDDVTSATVLFFFTEKTQKCPARSLIKFKNVFSLSMSVLFWWSGGELLVGWFCSETTTSIDKGFLSKAAARLK